FDATRAEVAEFFDGAESTLGSLKSELSRKLDGVMSRGRSDEERATGLIEFARAEMTQNEKVKTLLAAAGFVWGALAAIAGVKAIAAGAAIAFIGIEAAPILAILFGLVMMYVCGRYLLGVIRVFFERLDAAFE